MELDDKDWKILSYLSERGREKISDISNAIGIPRVTVYERMQNLVREGVIQRFTFIPNYKLIGLPVTAYIFVEFDPSEKVTQRELAKRVAQMPEVEEVHIVTGEWDLLLKVRAPSMEDIGNFVLDRLRETKGIAKTETITIFSTVKEWNPLRRVNRQGSQE
ncbi:transcriptional regulator [Thermogymnomonas acidicola]|uniref:Transcriptional regulator n=1 Tax=Thermogymnomonas acidicola TaxID=399579 RepID=A0AA37F9E5_9ARCH|nr:Lrp/AsnC family transcriptional regulator [Thermogymnomonas acidicola]GGM68724.1 transcriptional regulator [Thermogymnomonas acidicola]